MDEIKELLHNTIDEIDSATELLYQSKRDMQAVDTMLLKVDSCIKILSVNKSKKIEQNTIAILEKAMEAFQNNDIVLFADIFRYDLKHELELISQQL